jgi:hypothetical protein
MTIFAGIKQLKLRDSAICRQQFRVPKTEFAQWNMPGRGPRLVMFFRDDAGRPVQRTIQMARRPELSKAATSKAD